MTRAPCCEAKSLICAAVRGGTRAGDPAARRGGLQAPTQLPCSDTLTQCWATPNQLLASGPCRHCKIRNDSLCFVGWSEGLRLIVGLGGRWPAVSNVRRAGLAPEGPRVRLQDCELGQRHPEEVAAALCPARLQAFSSLPQKASGQGHGAFTRLAAAAAQSGARLRAARPARQFYLHRLCFCDRLQFGVRATDFPFTSGILQFSFLKLTSVKRDELI